MTSLEDWCKENKKEYLLEEWLYDKNVGLTPATISYGSNKKIWWICTKGHEWQMSAKERTGQEQKCPVCAGKRVLKGYNDLATLKPELVKEWDFEKNIGLVDGNNTDISTPDKVTLSSKQKVWWKCSYGHEWQAAIGNRIRFNAGCPVCTNKRIEKGYNDLETTNPEVARDWHPIKNGSLKSSDVTKGSSKRVWWVCQFGHEWKASIGDRVRGSRCPECSGKGTSIPEQGIAYYLEKVCTINQRIKISQKEIDIYLLDYRIGIEYDGKFFHTLENKGKEVEKDKVLSQCGIMLIRMKESDENIVRDGVIYFDSSNMGVNYEWALDQLCQMLVNVTKEKRFGLIDINVQRDSLLIREKISLYQKEKSLAVLYPEVAKEWHPTRNGSLTPEMFSAGANTKVWWQCSKGHEWEAIVNNRSKGAGCPICANARLLQGYNDLATVYPQILKEWHPTKNGNLTPKDVLSGTNKKVWWICPKGHEWKASINARASRNDGCPICSNKKVLKGYNDLETISPELAKEWHPPNNGLMKPSDVTSGSGKKIWWQCSKGHEWQAKVSDRFIKKSGCPICTNYTVLEGHNDLQTVYPEIAKEWHPTKNGALHPTDVICGSDKKVWWQCAKGHEWKTHIKSRTGRNCKCPICSNKQVLHGYNDLATIYPEIAKEWHPIKNGELQPTDITCGSGRKVWWKCSECNNEWKTTVTSRTARGEGCPLCSRKRGGVLRTQTIIYKKGALEENYPKLAQEWNSNKNGDLTPAAVNCGSEKKVWWQCSKGHEWEAAITNRVGQNQGCPICSNKKLLTGFNDLQTVRPEIAEEWWIDGYRCCLRKP